MILIPINVEEKVTIFRRKNSPDKICVTFVGESSFVNDPDYEPHFTVETSHGYAEEWIENVFGLDDTEYTVVEV